MLGLCLGNRKRNDWISNGTKEQYAVSLKWRWIAHNEQMEDASWKKETVQTDQIMDEVLRSKEERKTRSNGRNNYEKRKIITYMFHKKVCLIRVSMEYNIWRNNTLVLDNVTKAWKPDIIFNFVCTEDCW